MEDISVKAGNHEAPSGEESQVAQKKARLADSGKKKRKTTVDDLKKDIEAQKQIAQDNYEKFLRVYAELENYKKRVEKDRIENLRYANEELLRDLLPFIDNLQRAVDHASSEEDTNPGALMDGIELTLKDLRKLLEKHGLRPIESVGARFDPNLHEAMMQVENNVQEPQTVVQEFQKGYLFKDRLLRPARVSVAMRPESKAEEKIDGEGQPLASNSESSE